MSGSAFENQLSAWRSRLIAHVNSTESEEATAIDLLSQHHGELIRDAHGDISVIPEPSGEATFVDATEFARSRVLAEIAMPMRILSLDLRPGDTLVGPPFDLDWHVGTGGPLGRIGDLYTVQRDPESTSGAGIVIESQSDRTLYVSVTPIGTHRFSWLWADAHGLASRGGVATIAYRAGDPTPIFSRRATLWNVTGGDIPNAGNVAVLPTVPQSVLAGESGGDSIADAADTVVPPYTFRIPVAPISFYADPGGRYIVWIWLWQLFKGNDRGFLAMHTADMSGFSVSAAPPVILH